MNLQNPKKYSSEHILTSPIPYRIGFAPPNTKRHNYGVKSSPKIAVQYFGHLRTWKRCFALTNKNLLSKYDCDVFIHTWNTLDHTDSTWYSNPTSSDVGNFEAEIEDFKVTLQPKASMIEVQDFIKEERNLGPFAARGIRYSLYSMSQVNQLRMDFERRSGTAYDYVVMIRPDVEILESLDFNSYTKLFNQNPSSFIHFTSHILVVKSNRLSFPTPLAADVFFIGKSEGMNKILNIQEEFETSYVEIFNMLELGDTFFPEVGFLDSLRARGVTSRYNSLTYAIRRFNPKLDIIVFPSGTIYHSRKRKMLVRIASKFPSVARKSLSFFQRLVSVLLESTR